MREKNNDSVWERKKYKILFFAGLVGFFAYPIFVAVLNLTFYHEVPIGCLAMMGVGITKEFGK